MVKIGGPSLPPRNLTSDELNETQERHGLRGGDAHKGDEPKKVGHSPYVEQNDFVGQGAKRRAQGLELGDDAHAPIPLPQDDVDTSQWSLEGLDVAQGHLLGNSGKLRRARGKQGGKLQSLLALWEQLLEEDEGEEKQGEGDEQRRKKLAELAVEEPPSAEAMAAVALRVQAQFGVDFAGSEVGTQMMATSLLIAGHGQAVGPHADGSGLDAERLADGVQQVMDQSQSAVADARRMHEGVHKNLAMQRTFVAKKR